VNWSLEAGELCQGYAQPFQFSPCSWTVRRRATKDIPIRARYTDITAMHAVLSTANKVVLRRFLTSFFGEPNEEPDFILPVSS
jgi:hypothetical protein